MKTLNKTIFAATLCLFAAAPAFAGHGHDRDKSTVPYRVAQRLDHQQHRIAKGVRSGKLTHREVKKLRAEQREIRRLVRRFQSDGHFSGKELRYLDKRLDRVSLKIKRMKHNDIRRYVQLHERYSHADYARRL